MEKTSSARIAREEIPAETPDGQEVAELSGDQVTGLDRHVEAHDEMANSSRAEVAGIESPVEAPDDACQDMGKTSNARIIREEIPTETLEGQEVLDLGVPVYLCRAEDESM